MTAPVTMQSQLMAFIHESMPVLVRSGSCWDEIPERTETIRIIHWLAHASTT